MGKKLKYHYKAKKEASLKLRFHTQTAGCSLTAQQPEINIARTGFQALAGVLGGLKVFIQILWMKHYLFLPKKLLKLH